MEHAFGTNDFRALGEMCRDMEFNFVVATPRGDTLLLMYTLTPYGWKSTEPMGWEAMCRQMSSGTIYGSLVIVTRADGTRFEHCCNEVVEHDFDGMKRVVRELVAVASEDLSKFTER